MRGRDWLMFWMLGLIWGSSFLWIKIALQEIGPFTLVGWRLLIGVVTLGIAVVIRRPTLPRQRRVLAMLALLGVINTALPFVLISWGEQAIDSAVASVLNGTVPLFAMVFAHFALDDDRMTSSRVLGLLVGFAGVVVLLSGEMVGGGLRQSGLGQVAVLLAAVLYAASGVFARKNLREVSPMVQAFLPLIVADTLIWMGALGIEAPGLVPAARSTWIAVTWLGILGSGIAYLILFQLLHRIGPTRTSMVTYVFPLVGLVLGVVFLQEALTPQLVFGTAMIIAGILVVNGSSILQRRVGRAFRRPSMPQDPGSVGPGQG